MKRIEEISIKENRVRKLMEKLNLRGILLKTQANFCWFTGGGINEVTIADTKGVTSILITKNERIIISDNIESSRMIDDEKLADLGFTVLEFSWHSGSEKSEIKKIVDEKEIGCDIGGLGYKCCEEEIKELRYQLLESEIERYLWLGQKASLSVESILSTVKPGMRECAVTGEVLRVLWGDRIDSVCNQSAADDRSRKYRHPIPTENKIEKFLMLNVNARKWGLVTTISRSVYLGKMPGSLTKQFKDNVDIECQMIAATKIGTSMGDIFKRTVNFYEERGYHGEWEYHHQGGAQGYRNRDYLMYPKGNQKVSENQCFCWNPTIAGKKYGTKSEDAFIAAKDGPIMITKPVFFPVIHNCVDGIDFVRPGILEL